MTVVGLTGPTGAGKSTVSSLLASQGYYVADGDMVAREITAADSPVLSVLAGSFGSDIINSDGSLNRRLLAERAFASPEATAKLNGITHPAITKKIFSGISEAAKKGYAVAVIDAAALFESGIAGRCDLVAAVTAPEQIRLARITERDSISEAQVLRRMNAQKSEEYYEQKADIIIRNYSPYTIENEMKQLYARINEIVSR